MTVSAAQVRPFQVVPGRREPLKVMLVAGEASGDEHGAELVAQLRELEPGVRVFGMGGSRLRVAGMETIVDSESQAAVMGLTEVLGSIGKLLRALRTLKRAAKAERPDVVVLIDFPDFNLLFARSLRGSGAAVLYFITPQLWAWRRGRVRTIRRSVRKVAPIFPFEENYFQRHGIDAEYVGHPFLARPEITVSKEELFASAGLDPARPVFALLPGSRKAEAESLLQPMLEAFDRLKASRPAIQAAIPVAPTLQRAWFEERLGGRTDIVLLDGRARELLRYSRAAIVASGTATVEAALAGVPFIVVYRFSPFTYRMAKLLVRGVRHFAMPNLIAGKKVVPELLQEEVSGERLALELERIIGDPERERRLRAEIAQIGERLRAGLDGASPAARTARIVLELAEERMRRSPGRFSREIRARAGGRA